MCHFLPEDILNLESILSPWLIWFVIGVGLALLELQMPAFIVIFFGIGCWVVAGFLLIWPLTITQQVSLFTAATIISIIFLRKFVIRVFRGSSSDKAENGYDDFPKGLTVKVAKKITPQNNGRINFRGTIWDAASDEEIEEGETVQIIRYANDSRQIFWVQKN